TQIRSCANNLERQLTIGTFASSRFPASTSPDGPRRRWPGGRVQGLVGNRPPDAVCYCREVADTLATFADTCARSAEIVATSAGSNGMSGDVVAWSGDSKAWSADAGAWAARIDAWSAGMDKSLPTRRI